MGPLNKKNLSQFAKIAMILLSFYQPIYRLNCCPSIYAFIASFEPSFWANDLAPWSQVTNIAHPQKTKFGTCTSEILKEGIRRRLVSKNLDPEKHVTQNINKIAERNKERYRKGYLKKGSHQNSLTLLVRIYCM